MNLLIRADASTEIGSGHVMRMLGLAQGLKREGHRVSFLHVCPGFLRARLRSEGFESAELTEIPGSPNDAAATIRRAHEGEVEWVIADGYGFSSTYQLSLQEAGIRVLLVDDNSDADGYPADLVLNQSLHADPSLYAGWYDSRRFLLGPKYALFRKEFREWVGWKREIVDVPKCLLVSLGGLPDPSWLPQVLRGLSSIDLRIIVASGIPSRYFEDQDRREPIEIRADVENMADLITRCDIGLTAGGGTTREFLFLGLPFAVVEVAENQTFQSQFLEDLHLSLRLGSIGALDEHAILHGVQSIANDRSERIRMSAAGQALIDGRGVDRVVSRLGT